MFLSCAWGSTTTTLAALLHVLPLPLPAFTRSALEFMMAIMRELLAQPGKTMSEVVYEQYYATLNKWHGFWASSAFNVSQQR